jgi:putative transcriptional regulator
LLITINLEPLLLRQKVNSSMLADKLNMTKANFYILKTNKAKLIRMSTLDSICRYWIANLAIS